MFSAGMGCICNNSCVFLTVRLAVNGRNVLTFWETRFVAPVSCIIVFLASGS